VSLVVAEPLAPFEDPLSEHVRSKPRLVAFVERMAQRYPREVPKV
jgi:hypothetical protein